MRHSGLSRRQRPADLGGAAVPAGACQLSHAHDSADTTTTGGSQLWLVGQPKSSCAWAGLGAAPGSCREQLTRPRPAAAAPEPAAPATAITPSIAGLQRRAGSAPGWPGWHATRASSPGYAGHQGGTSPATRAACQLPEDNRTRNLSGCLVHPTPHYAEPGGGSDAARRQVIQVPAGCARTGRRPTIRLTEPTGDITEAGGGREQSPVVLKAFITARPAE